MNFFRAQNYLRCQLWTHLYKILQKAHATGLVHVHLSSYNTCVRIHAHTQTHIHMLIQVAVAHLTSYPLKYQIIPTEKRSYVNYMIRSKYL